MIPKGAILVLSYSKVHIQIPALCCFGLIFFRLAATMIFTGALSGLSGQPEGQGGQQAKISRPCCSAEMLQRRSVLDLIVLQHGTASGSGGERAGPREEMAGDQGARTSRLGSGANGIATSMMVPGKQPV